MPKQRKQPAAHLREWLEAKDALLYGEANALCKLQGKRQAQNNCSGMDSEGLQQAKHAQA